VSSKRVTASDRVRAEIDGLFADRERELGSILEEVARSSVRLVFQSALEAEVTEFLGRDRYARGERARAGMRNGYSDTTIKTTAGAVKLERPQGPWHAGDVLVAAVGQARHAHQRARELGDLRVGAWPVGP